jgi:hypothetical protein
MDQGTAAIIGVIIGGLLTMVPSIFAHFSKRKKFQTAISYDIAEAIDLIDRKLEWMERPLPQEIIDMYPDLMVRINDKFLFLGEKEQLSFPLIFWKTYYFEIVSLIDHNKFKKYHKAYRLINDFKNKFDDMKASFLGTSGDPKIMALACYKDLKKIREKLNDYIVLLPSKD